MFSGIVEAIGTVRTLHPAPYGKVLEVEFPERWTPQPGSSIAINGACLTLIAIEGRVGVFDVVLETLERTNLKDLHPGDRVNLERSLKLGDRLEGHFVLGHIDGLAVVTEIAERSLFSVPEQLTPFIVEKGSIALDGVSLTVVSIEANLLTVALIPYTLEHTTLGLRRPGDKVNMEVDILARYVQRLGRGEGLTENFLRSHGFC